MTPEEEMTLEDRILAGLLIVGLIIFVVGFAAVMIAAIR